MELKKKKEEVEMELKMEKLRLAKEQRCIIKTQADIIQNTRKAMHEIKVDRDQLAEEKELETVVADLNSGHGSKEKLEQIKAILLARRGRQSWINNSKASIYNRPWKDGDGCIFW